MKVLKFGGTSVGRPERMHSVAELITADAGQKIVVLSALSGTTNTLVEIGSKLFANDKPGAETIIDNLYQHYLDFHVALVKDEQNIKACKQVIDEHFDWMRNLLNVEFSEPMNKELLAQGELLSTKMFEVYLKEINVKGTLLPALEYMRIDEYSEPDIAFLKTEITKLVDENPGFDIYVTQGYICMNHKGEVDNLKRGGSDYTATLIGAAIQSEEVQIWTDIDGMHNNDPRIVDKTYPIRDLSFNEASELAYFGAKILHPSSIWPVQQYNVPTRLLNTMDPKAPGTYISSEEKTSDVKAIAAKDKITAIRIKSTRMLLAYGFLRKIFEIFEKYRTPIDMITTSEVAVSVSIDDSSHLESIVKELEDYGMVMVDTDQTIICIVGNLVVQKKGIVKKVFEALEEYPIRMISYGGSRYNISILVDSQYKREILISLNKALFNL
jgi:aspartate kinase